MSFTIFAAGTGGFHFVRNRVEFQDVYDVADGISQLHSAATSSPRDFAIGQATGAATPTSPLRQALNAIGGLVGFSLLRENVKLLAAEMAPIDVMVYARETRTFWVDNSAVATVTLTTSDMNPALTFFRRVNPVLQETEMATFGVLTAISEVMSRFCLKRGSSGGRTMLNIQLFR